MAPHEKPRSKKCDSDQLVSEAIAEYSIETGEWVLRDVLPRVHCESCGYADIDECCGYDDDEAT